MASIASYGVCQTACNAVAVACYSAAGFTFGTVTAGASTPAVIVGCNSALSVCMTACATKFLAEGAAETATWGSVLCPIVGAGAAGAGGTALWGLSGLFGGGAATASAGTAGAGATAASTGSAVASAGTAGAGATAASTGSAVASAGTAGATAASTGSAGTVWGTMTGLFGGGASGVAASATTASTGAAAATAAAGSTFILAGGAAVCLVAVGFGVYKLTKKDSSESASGDSDMIIATTSEVETNVVAFPDQIQVRLRSIDEIEEKDQDKLKAVLDAIGRQTDFSDSEGGENDLIGTVARLEKGQVVVRFDVSTQPGETAFANFAAGQFLTDKCNSLGIKSVGAVANQLLKSADEIFRKSSIAFSLATRAMVDRGSFTPDAKANHTGGAIQADTGGKKLIEVRVPHSCLEVVVDGEAEAKRLAALGQHELKKHYYTEFIFGSA